VTAAVLVVDAQGSRVRDMTEPFPGDGDADGDLLEVASFFACERESGRVECVGKQLWDGDWERPEGLGARRGHHGGRRPRRRGAGRVRVGDPAPRRVLHERTGKADLCFAGGTALNCSANGRLLRESRAAPDRRAGEHAAADALRAAHGAAPSCSTRR